MIIGFFASRQHLGEIVRAVVQRGQQRRRGAELVTRVGQVGLGRRSGRSACAFASQRLADARVQHRRFLARIGAHDQDRVGLLDPGDRGVEAVEIPPRRIQPARRPAGSPYWPSPARPSGPSAPACSRRRTDRRRWRRCGRRTTACSFVGDGVERLRPGRGAQLAVLAAPKDGRAGGASTRRARSAICRPAIPRSRPH